MSSSLVLGLYAQVTNSTFLRGYWGSKLGPRAFAASTLQAETALQLPKLPPLKLLIFSAPAFSITHTFGSSHFDVCGHLASSLSSVIYPTTRTFIFLLPGVAMEANRAWSKLTVISAVAQR